MNTPQPPILRLALELRLEIYALACQQPKPIPYTRLKTPHSTKALLSTNRQIRTELKTNLISIHTKHNSIAFTSPQLNFLTTTLPKPYHFITNLALQNPTPTKTFSNSLVYIDLARLPKLQNIAIDIGSLSTMQTTPRLAFTWWLDDVPRSVRDGRYQSIINLLRSGFFTPYRTPGRKCDVVINAEMPQPRQRGAVAVRFSWNLGPGALDVAVSEEQGAYRELRAPRGRHWHDPRGLEWVEFEARREERGIQVLASSVGSFAAIYS